MALNDALENLKTTKSGILDQANQEIEAGKRFDPDYVNQALAPIKPLKKIIEQCIALGIESEALTEQIHRMNEKFNEYNPLITYAKHEDEPSGWFCFKKIIPGEFYVKKQDAKALKKHLNELAPFTPSNPIILLGEQVLALKSLAENNNTHQPIYNAFRELYIALYQEEAARKKTTNPDQAAYYQNVAHQRITEAHTNVARDIVKHGGIPAKFHSLHRMQKEFHRLKTETIHPKVRTAVAIVVGALIGAALGFGLGLAMGGITAIPGMFAGALLCGTLCGMGLSTALVPLVTAPIAFFHAAHKIKRHTAHASIMENEGINQASQKIAGLR
ncbi:MAG TPA: hypothetical protein VFU82_01830 [Gammaproteobacteria bacterium]|nr:hypothetical protein [Gammaproteobacteria bacterium]